MNSLNVFLFCSYLHFDIWVRVAVSIHGRQVNTAHNANNKTVGLGAIHKGNQNPSALLDLATILPWLRQVGMGNVFQSPKELDVNI